MVCETHDSRRVRRHSIRHQEVQQTPQFHEVVLKRRAGEQQSSRRLEPKQRLPALRSKVLDVVRLVEDHVHPVLPAEDVLIGQHDLVGRDAHLPGVLRVPTLSLLLALLLVAIVREDLETGEEFLEFHLPIEDHRRRDDDEMLTPYALVASEVAEQRNGLDRFAECQSARTNAYSHSPQAHLIGENAVHAVRIETRQPLEPSLLVRSEGASKQEGRSNLVSVLHLANLLLFIPSLALR